MLKDDKYGNEWINDLAEEISSNNHIIKDLSESSQKILAADDKRVLFRMAKGFVGEFVRQQHVGAIHVNLEDRYLRTVDDFEEAEKQGQNSLFQVKACIKKLAEMGISQEDNFNILSVMIKIAVNSFSVKASVPMSTVSVRKDDGLKAYSDSLYANEATQVNR